MIGSKSLGHSDQLQTLHRIYVQDPKELHLHDAGAPARLPYPPEELAKHLQISRPRNKCPLSCSVTYQSAICRTAMAVAAALVSTPILRNTCSRCLFTVRGLMPRISLMVLLVLP